MKHDPFVRARCRGACSQGGFTLVELMVALLLSLLLAVAILKMQSKIASQSVRMSDTGTRDTQARAAMDLITRDLSSAGFLMGASQYYCDALFTYNTSGGGFFVHHPVDALPAVSGSTMTFAPTLTLNYPSGAAPLIASDVLMMTMATDSTQFNDATNPTQTGSPTSGVNPLATGQLPLVSTTGLTAGDAAIVSVRLANATLGMKACLRVPVSTVTGTGITSSMGPIMPPGTYNDFVAPVAAAGFPAALTNGPLFSSNTTDIGNNTSPSPTSTQVFNVYYVDNGSGYPVLMRAQYSLADDKPTLLVPAPQPIAAGVVALRVSFGVDTAFNNTVGTYESAAQVTANNHWGLVRSVRVGLVTRTINDDPNADYTSANAAAPAASSITIGPALKPWFPAFNVPVSSHRYVVNTTEIAYRDWLWRN